MCMRTIQKQYAQAMQDLPPGVDIVQDHDYEYGLLLSGTSVSWYRGETLVIAVEFSGDYPFSPPQVHLLASSDVIAHPNIDPKDGAFCLRDWCPAFTFLQLVHHLVALLDSPDLEDGAVLNVEAARAYRLDPSTFFETARTRLLASNDL